MENNNFNELTLDELEKIHELNAKMDFSLLDENTSDNLLNELAERKKELFKLENFLGKYFKDIVGDSITYIHFVDICNDELLADVINIEDRHMAINYSQNYSYLLEYMVKFAKEVSADEYDAVYRTISDCYNNLLKKYK